MMVSFCFSLLHFNSIAYEISISNLYSMLFAFCGL